MGPGLPAARQQRPRKADLVGLDDVAHECGRSVRPCLISAWRRNPIVASLPCAQKSCVREEVRVLHLSGVIS